jgi:phosphoribosylformylglycinamidine synthase
VAWIKNSTTKKPMKEFTALVYVSSKEACRNPEEEVVLKATHELGFPNVKKVRMAKCFRVTLDAEPDAHAQVGKICKKLLAQSVAEEFQIGDISYSSYWPA